MKKVVFVYLIGSFALVYPCVVTLYNDGKGPIQVLDHNSAQNKNSQNAPMSLPIIPKKSSRRIGDPQEHAHFTVYIKHPKQETFVAAYEVKQNECNNSGNPQLKLSDLHNKANDIESKNDDVRLFTITDKRKHYTSRVRQLPSIQRADIYKETGCRECQ